MLYIFIIIAYILLPILTTLIYKMEIVALYPDFIVSELVRSMFGSSVLFYLFMTQILLGSRVKFLERGVGLPKVMKIHIITTTATLLFLLLHERSKTGSYSISTLTGYIVFYSIFFVLFVSTCLWLDTPYSRWPIIRTLKNWAHRRFQYHHFRLVHNLMGIAAIVIFIHINVSSMAEETFYTIIIMNTYFLFAFGLYFHHKLIRPIVLRGRVWEVVDVILETNQENAKHISTIKMHQLTGKPFNYQAGQFGFFRFITGALNLRGEEHPFSFSSSPKEDRLGITVQSDGDYTSIMHQKCKVGDKVVMDGPYGVFSIEKATSNTKHVVGIAGGIGISPFIGWLEEAKRNSTISFTLLWMRSEMEDSLAKKILEYNKLENVEIQIFSRQRLRPIDIETLKQFIDTHSHVYVCASSSLVKKMSTELKCIGISHKNIHSELFSM